MAVAGVFVDVWLIFIAVFIFVAARSEEAALHVHLALQGKRVRDYMRPPPVDVSQRTPPVGLVLSADDDVEAAVERALSAGFDTAWVADDGVIEGVFVVNDIAVALERSSSRP